MRVFLTWSGETSHRVADALHDWIPMVLQRVKPFLSSEDIRKGARWDHEISQQLSEVEFAIVCLTRENLEAPWVHFEAGAVSKHVATARVTALLIDIKPADVVGPLVQFQHTSASKADIQKLLSEINQMLGVDALPADRFSATFETFWPRLEEKMAQAQQTVQAATPPKRSDQDVLLEILELGRNTKRDLASFWDQQERVVAILERLHRFQARPAPPENLGLGGLLTGTDTPRNLPGGLLDAQVPVQDKDGKLRFARFVLSGQDSASTAGTAPELASAEKPDSTKPTGDGKDKRD